MKRRTVKEIGTSTDLLHGTNDYQHVQGSKINLHCFVSLPIYLGWVCPTLCRFVFYLLLSFFNFVWRILGGITKIHPLIQTQFDMLLINICSNHMRTYINTIPMITWNLLVKRKRSGPIGPRRWSPGRPVRLLFVIHLI